MYAEIYFSNEIQETNEKFEDNSIRTIQDIKNATHSCIPSTSQSKSSPISKGIQNPITTEEINKKSEHQLSQGPDKNLNLEKQKNFDTTFDNTPSRIPNEIVNKSLNSQQKSQKSQKNKSEIMKDSKNNNSPILKNGQNQNNTFNSPAKVNTPSTTPKSAKRKSKNDKDYESARKRRSVEYCESIDVDSDSQIYPVVLNSKKSWSGDNSPIISHGAMDILFPKGWKEKKKVDDAEKAKGKKRKTSKSSKPNNDVGEKKQGTEKEDIIDIISSESSDDSPINDTRKSKKRIESNNKSTLPIWLNSSSDSEESILEVPVPPKPTPPLVNVKDSDTNTSDSDDGIYDLNSMPAKKKFQSKSDDSEEGLENNSKNTAELDDNLVQNSQENSQTRQISESENSSDNSERNINNSQSSLTANSNNSSRNCSYVTVDSGDESSSVYADEEDDEPIQDLILNYTLSNSLPSRQKIGKSTADRETRNDSNEYFEPLNDNPQPSTSKQTISKNLKMKSSREKTDEEYFFEPMIEAVKSFYNNSWGGENYSVEEVRSKMSSKLLIKIKSRKILNIF